MMLAVEFGSGKRGDCDYTSDRDLLLISTDWKKIMLETERKSTEGFSVSSFLLNKATYLVNSGSLFFKHISDEGVLVSGSKNDYRILMSGWQAAADYKDEAYENIDLLEVINFIPRSPQGVAAAVDILISSVRNILIRRLACDGEYVFSWESVFTTAENRKIIKKEDIKLLLVARRIKNLYRQGHIASISIQYFEALLEASSRACGVALQPRYATRAELRSLPEKYADGSYKQLRAMELMCAEYPFDCTVDSLLNLVRRPAYFCANGPNIKLH